MLKLDAVRVSFGAREVLPGLSLEVAAGEMMVLAGPSGSGKSTLLRAIAGLVATESGEIAIGGKPVGRLPPGRREVAMVFQNYALLPHLTLFENLAFGPAARGTRSAQVRERILAVANSLGLAALIDRYPRELSGGERQRAALARAMLRDPKVFLLDEPLSNLDAPLRVRARAEILRLLKRLSSATLYVTHDQSEALAIGDRLGILRDGRLVQLGAPLDVYRRPASLFVARFLGNPAMNLLDVVAAPPGAVLWQNARLTLPAQTALAESGRKLVFGIRPEHVYLDGSRWAQASDQPPVDARVDVVERVGDQQYLLLEAQGQALTARAEPELRVAAGDALKVRFDGAAGLLFDPLTEERLGP